MSRRAGLTAFLSRVQRSTVAVANVHRSTVSLPDRDLPLVIRRHPTARSMVLRLATDGSEARVTLPRWDRIAAAERFARSRADWLAEQLAALPAPITIAPGASVPYRGRLLTIRWRADAPRTPRIEAATLYVGGPGESLPARLCRWLKSEALALFESDILHFAAAAGVTPGCVALTGAQRRWGSCSADGTLRLNWRLVMAPDPVRRSVVAHEIAHLVHFDHGRDFHALVARIFDGDLPAAEAWLKREGRGLYAPFG